MSAPLNLTTEQLRQIATALDTLSEITNATGIDFTPWGPQQIGLAGNSLSYSWNAEAKAYAIDDRNRD